MVKMPKCGTRNSNTMAKSNIQIECAVPFGNISIGSFLAAVPWRVLYSCARNQCLYLYWSTSYIFKALPPLRGSASHSCFPSTSPAMKFAVAAFFLFLSPLCGAYSGEQKLFTSIISFGDSYVDTGNLVRWEDPVLADVNLRNLPYGETFFGHPSGRDTDGRVVLDFIGILTPLVLFFFLLPSVTMN